jgi:hypothetical protein
MRFLILVTAISLAASQAAADIDPIRGFGNASCSELSRAFEEHPLPVVIDVGVRQYASRTALYSEWLLGYISAFDRIQRATSLPGARDSASRLSDSNALNDWVRDWCSEHPIARVSDAAWAFLVGELGLETEAE